MALIKVWPKGRCGKVAYPTKEDAEARIAYLRMVEPVTHGNLQRAYSCWTCSAWHLTSKEKTG